MRNKPTRELQELLHARALRLEELAADVAQKRVSNVREIRGVRKDIARIKTLLHTYP